VKNYLLFILICVSLFNVTALIAMKNRDKQDVAQQNYIKSPQQELEEPDLKPKPEPEPEPLTSPSFVDVPKARESEPDSIYGDIISHSQGKPFGDHHGRSTNAHETAHGIHSWLRKKYRQDKKVNGFYCLEGRGAIIEEPQVSLYQIRRYVPRNLRSYRYDLYLVQQASQWNDIPLYVYDEWTAYVLDGKTSVDDVQKGRHSGRWSDGVSGCLEFSIYAVAACMAIEQYDNDYWESNKQFRDFTIWMLRQAHETYMMGRQMEQFKWEKQDKLYNEFLTSPSARVMRDFIYDNLEGVWLNARPVSHMTYKPHQRVELEAKFHPDSFFRRRDE